MHKSTENEYNVGGNVYKSVQSLKMCTVPHFYGRLAALDIYFLFGLDLELHSYINQTSCN